MAGARHFTYAELRAMESTFTQNDVSFTVHQQEDAVVVVGFDKGNVTIRSGDRLAARNREVWRIPAPDSYKDPIRRFLASHSLSQELLQSSRDAHYHPADEERHVAGECVETKDNDVSTIVGGDLALIVKPSDLFPLYVVTLFIRKAIPLQDKALLVPWMEEILVTKEYADQYGEGRRYAYSDARCICVRSGIKWGSPDLHQTGKSFRAKNGCTYTIHAYRHLHRLAGTSEAWTPQIRKVIGDTAYAQSLAVLREEGVLAEWVDAVDAREICEECGSKLHWKTRNYAVCLTCQ